ncbi:hypothetical protein BH24ACI3_BH24ACI3_00310 [soil metagenome]
MSEQFSLLQQNSRPLHFGTREAGAKGEALAAEYLTRNGYRLVMANFKAPIGRNSKGVQVTGEIDLVAIDGETLCFIEVKTRATMNFGGPLSAVDNQKQRQITRTARVYKKIFGLYDIEQRFDVVTVLMAGTKPEIDLIRGFWSENKFNKKKYWDDDIY